MMHMQHYEPIVLHHLLQHHGPMVAVSHHNDDSHYLLLSIIRMLATSLSNQWLWALLDLLWRPRTWGESQRLLSHTSRALWSAWIFLASSLLTLGLIRALASPSTFLQPWITWVSTASEVSLLLLLLSSSLSSSLPLSPSALPLASSWVLAPSHESYYTSNTR